MLDALGNVTRTLREVHVRQLDEMPRESVKYTYERGTGRLLVTHELDSNQNDPGVVVSARDYDASGNLAHESSSRIVTYPGGNLPPSGYGQGQLEERAVYYYGADERFRVVDRQSCVFAVLHGKSNAECLPPYFANPGAFEECRYDALGRRILVRTSRHCARKPTATRRRYCIASPSRRLCTRYARRRLSRPG